MDDDGQLQLIEDPDDGRLPILTYENFLPVEATDVFKRVVRIQMGLARRAREAIVAMVGGTIGDGSRSNKEFVHTHLGKYRIAMGVVADNSTEHAAHDRMRVNTVNLGDPLEILAFFRAHGVDPIDAYWAVVNELQKYVEGKR